MNASDLSRYEFCGRLPSLFQMYEPKKLPIREAVKRYFERGVRYRFSGVQDAPERIREEFVKEASERGYEYPAGEPYIIAQDHADWLYGSLQFLPSVSLEPLPLLQLEDQFLDSDGYYFGDTAHLFRITERFDSRLRWPELLLAGQYRVVIHSFRLPLVSRSSVKEAGGRLCSPANMAYRHPLTGQLRLARLEGEDKRFANSWKRVGRWEEADIEWPEWQLGIQRDKCLNQLYRAEEAAMEFTPEEIKDIHRDAVQMSVDMERPHPRKRERCQSCMFLDLCHGGEDGKRRYLLTNEVLRGLRTREVAGAVS